MSLITDNMPAFLASIKAMKKEVFVGVPQKAGQRQEGHIDNATLAYIQDKGSPAQNIPPRPFMEPGIKNSQAAIVDALKEAAIAAFDSQGIDAGLNKAGLIGQTGIKKAIVVGEGFEGLSDRTLAARKKRGVTRTKPLIDTGALLNSITYEVRNGTN